MALFVCRGECESCTETETCPVKSEMQSAGKNFLTDRFGSTGVVDIMLNIISRISHKDFISVLGTSLFKLIQLIMIESKESGRTIHLSREYLQNRIEEICPERMRGALENFHRGSSGIRNDPITKRIVQVLIPGIADQILLALERKCGKKCHSCCLNEHCPVSCEDEANQ